MNPTKQEIEDYMELYNDDQVGLNNGTIDMEEAEYQLLNSDKYHYLHKKRDGVIQTLNNLGFIEIDDGIYRQKNDNPKMDIKIEFIGHHDNL